MKHSFWDRYSDIESPVHKIKPGIKLAVSLLLIILLSTLPYKPLLYSVVFVFLFLVVTLTLSKVPVMFIMKRILMLIPLLLPVIILNYFFLSDGIFNSTVITLRSLLSVFVLVLLISVTRFRDLIKTFKQWHLPRIIILTLSFMYRYFFLLTDESEKMVRSVKIRSAGGSKLKMIKIYSHILGILFVKSYERSDRVYKAMVMRGFSGEEDIL